MIEVFKNYDSTHNWLQQCVITLQSTHGPWDIFVSNNNGESVVLVVDDERKPCFYLGHDVPTYLEQCFSCCFFKVYMDWNG